MLLYMIGDRLKELRNDANMTQGAFGEIVGTSKQYVSQLELGKNIMPSGEFLEGWARHFEVCARWLVSGTGPKYLKNDTSHHSHSLRLDPARMTEVHKALREIVEDAGMVFNLEDEVLAERFLHAYELRDRMSASPSDDEWTKYGAKLARIMTPQGAKEDGRGDGVPAQGTDKGGVARRIRGKA